MSGDELVRFGTLHPDGRMTDERAIPQAAIRACPFVLVVAEHYREDGSCRCDDPDHRATMLADWGYTPADFEGIPLRPG